jgi:CRP/FNR family transcriptional regulator, nitrogen oxide reductase regulator
MHDVNMHFRELAFGPGDLVYESGQPATCLYVVAEGEIRLVHHTARGRDVVMDLLGSGEYFGSLETLGDREYAECAQASHDSCVLRITARDFRALVSRYPSIAERALDVLAKRLQDAQDAVRASSSAPAEARIARVLIRLAGKSTATSKVGQARTSLSRQGLAALSGTTIETASRVVSRFRRAGLIQSGRGWIAVRDAGALKALAG